MERRKFVGTMATIAAVPLVQPGRVLGRLAEEVTGHDQISRIGRAKEEVREFIDAFDQATIKKDVAALEKMLSDDFVFSGPNGATRNKKEMISDATAGLVRTGTEDLGHDIKINGNTAIITGNFRMTGSIRGKAITGEFQSTQTLVKDNGKWLAVASSVTRVAKKGRS